MVRRGPLTKEQKARAKYNAVQRTLGRPSLINNAQSVAHVQWLHECGMTVQHIADVAGVSLGCTYNQLVSATDKIHRNNQDKLLAVKPDGEMHPYGARMDPFITGRKLGVLAATGFPIRWLEPVIDIAHNNLLKVYRGQARWVFANTVEKVAATFTALWEQDPNDYGVTLNAQHVARHYAARHGHAPAHCWDTDTINDPQAFAEWTGACGTRQGYLIHKNGSIPICRPCAVKKYQDRKEGRNV